MRALLSPKQVAQAIGVSESSLKRWCDKGLLKISRTAGGHRRLALNAVVQFLRQTGQPLAHPELLGLPINGEKLATGGTVTTEMLSQALVSGDEQRCRSMLLGLYLDGRRIADLCDELLAPAFVHIGRQWEHGTAAVYEERRAVEICLRLLHEFRMMLPAVDRQAPQAFGTTLSGDPYKLPTTMAELALRELGWRAESYGVELPAETLQSAVRRVRPRLFWLSVSAIAPGEQFERDCAALYDAAVESQVAMAVGGRALSGQVRRSIRYHAYCQQLHDLTSFARSLVAQPEAREPGE